MQNHPIVTVDIIWIIIRIFSWVVWSWPFTFFPLVSHGSGGFFSLDISFSWLTSCFFLSLSDSDLDADDFSEFTFPSSLLKSCFLLPLVLDGVQLFPPSLFEASSNFSIMIFLKTKKLWGIVANLETVNCVAVTYPCWCFASKICGKTKAERWKGYSIIYIRIYIYIYIYIYVYVYIFLPLLAHPVLPKLAVLEWLLLIFSSSLLPY